jgi:hypothetical protein
MLYFHPIELSSKNRLQAFFQAIMTHMPDIPTVGQGFTGFSNLIMSREAVSGKFRLQDGVNR